MAGPIDNVTVESLEAMFPGEGFSKFKEIAELGGFGTPSVDHTGGIDPAYRGGLDLKGFRALPDALKADRDKLKSIMADKTQANAAKRFKAEPRLAETEKMLKSTEEALKKIDSILAAKNEKETK
jgi:hypothetical protein